MCRERSTSVIRDRAGKPVSHSLTACLRALVLVLVNSVSFYRELTFVQTRDTTDSGNVLRRLPPSSPLINAEGMSATQQLRRDVVGAGDPRPSVKEVKAVAETGTGEPLTMMPSSCVSGSFRPLRVPLDMAALWPHGNQVESFPCHVQSRRILGSLMSDSAHIGDINPNVRLVNDVSILSRRHMSECRSL